VVNRELQALLAVQADDVVIREIDARRSALAPKMALLDATQKRAVEEVARTEASLERELTRQRVLEARLAETRSLHEKYVSVLNNAEKLREATAAASQVESTKRALADGESEALVISRRIGDLRTALAAHREVLAQISHEQGNARSEMEATLASIDAELATARVKRQLSAAGVGSGLLSKYDRIATRRQSAALIELRDFYCSACDTAIPLQRRPAFTTGSVIEPCEGCGVLLFHQSGA
jgi:predicted  nucleic acid-binding Zn-ribbon protein